MTTAEISDKLVTYGGIKKPMFASRLGMLLEQQGYLPVRRRISNTPTRGWIVYQRDTEKIHTLKKLLKD